MRIQTYNTAIVNLPKNNIYAGDDYAFAEPITLIIISDPQAYDYQLRIINPNGGECFRSKNGKVVYDINNIPKFNIDNIFDTTKIYFGKDTKTPLATIKTKNSDVARKYSVEFYNQATGVNEILDMNCDKLYCSCGIFQGKESENSPIISKFYEILDANAFESNTLSKYAIEMPPNVDKTLMIALAVFFTKESNRYKHKRFEKAYVH